MTKVFGGPVLWLILSFPAQGDATSSSRSKFIKQVFKGSDVCFIMADIDSGKIVQQLNKNRCDQKFDICSTFKLVLTSMAFESGYFKSVDHHIQWDGKKHSRKAENRHQTPRSFVNHSVNWVGDRIIHDLGIGKVRAYLNKFGFGNVAINSGDEVSKISHGLLKVSAQEQIKFLQRLWSGGIVTDDAFKKIKTASEVKTTESWSLYGKTGTGCIDRGCMSKPGRQLGWFVGVLEKSQKRYAFAFNQSTRSPIAGYAGPLTEQNAIKFFSKFFDKNNNHDGMRRKSTP
jgi:beta-lactamase class D